MIKNHTSFRVRPMMVNYVYQGKKIDSIQKFAFIIERHKFMAKRLNMSTYKNTNFYPNRTYRDQMNLIDVFQYMIGNTDYSVYKLHNIKLILGTSNLNKVPLAIPYDFDWSGLISAAYAFPNPMFGANKKLEDRVNRGFELDPNRIQKTFDHFNAKRAEILDLFENEPLLSKSEKNRVRGYLVFFYRIINRKDAAKNFVKSSRSLEQ